MRLPPSQKFRTQNFAYDCAGMSDATKLDVAFRQEFEEASMDDGRRRRQQIVTTGSRSWMTGKLIWGFRLPLDDLIGGYSARTRLYHAPTTSRVDGWIVETVGRFRTSLLVKMMMLSLQLLLRRWWMPTVGQMRSCRCRSAQSVRSRCRMMITVNGNVDTVVFTAAAAAAATVVFHHCHNSIIGMRRRANEDRLRIAARLCQHERRLAVLADDDGSCCLVSCCSCYDKGRRIGRIQGRQRTRDGDRSPIDDRAAMDLGDYQFGFVIIIDVGATASTDKGCDVIGRLHLFGVFSSTSCRSLAGGYRQSTLQSLGHGGCRRQIRKGLPSFDLFTWRRRLSEPKGLFQGRRRHARVIRRRGRRIGRQEESGSAARHQQVAALHDDQLLAEPEDQWASVEIAGPSARGMASRKESEREKERKKVKSVIQYRRKF